MTLRCSHTGLCGRHMQQQAPMSGHWSWGNPEEGTLASGTEPPTEQLLPKHQEEVQYARKVILQKALSGVPTHAWSAVSLRTSVHRQVWDWPRLPPCVGSRSLCHSGERPDLRPLRFRPERWRQVLRVRQCAKHSKWANGELTQSCCFLPRAQPCPGGLLWAAFQGLRGCVLVWSAFIRV